MSSYPEKTADELKADYLKGIVDGRMLSYNHLRPVIVAASSTENSITMIHCQRKDDDSEFYYVCERTFADVRSDIRNVVLLYNRECEKVEGYSPETQARLHPAFLRTLLMVRKVAEDSINAFEKGTGLLPDQNMAIDAFQSDRFEYLFRREMSHFNDSARPFACALDVLHEQDVNNTGGGLAQKFKMAQEDNSPDIALEAIMGQVKFPAFRN